MKNSRTQLVRYVAVGISTFAIYLGVGALLDDRGLARAWQATIAFTAAVSVNYLLQRSWVFEDGRPISTSLPRYAAMVGIGYTVNAAAFVALSPILSLLWAQTAAAVLVVLSNAALSLTWVFRGRCAASDGFAGRTGRR